MKIPWKICFSCITCFHFPPTTLASNEMEGAVNKVKSKAITLVYSVKIHLFATSFRKSNYTSTFIKISFLSRQWQIPFTMLSLLFQTHRHYTLSKSQVHGSLFANPSTYLPPSFIPEAKFFLVICQIDAHRTQARHPNFTSVLLQKVPKNNALPTPSHTISTVCINFEGGKSFRIFKGVMQNHKFKILSKHTLLSKNKSYVTFLDWSIHYEYAV